MYPVWTSVLVTNPDHARHGQAGTVFKTDPAKKEEVVVKFDLDGQQEAVQIADLKAL